MRISLMAFATIVLLVGCSSSDERPVGSSAGGSVASAGGGGSSQGVGGAGSGSGGLDLTSSSSTGPGGAGGCLETLTMRVRDFSQDHPDFQWGGHPNFGQITGVLPGILANDLAQEPNGDFKPVYIAGSDVSPNGPTFGPFTGAANFDAWYRDTPGVNHAVNVELPLQGDGTTLSYDDGDFHPIGPRFGFGDEAFELNGNANNWHFTTEARVQFRYDGGELFTFRGDDDIWIFINHRLAIDLGGLHGPVEASVNLDQEAATLGLVLGETFDLHVFHAERNYSGSNYRFETSDFCFLPVDPPQ
jgi:fibro-slime domain-containing protein